MIDIVDIKGKKFIFIDENAFGMSPDFFSMRNAKKKMAMCTLVFKFK